MRVPVDQPSSRDWIEVGISYHTKKGKSTPYWIEMLEKITFGEAHTYGFYTPSHPDRREECGRAFLGRNHTSKWSVLEFKVKGCKICETPITVRYDGFLSTYQDTFKIT